MEKTKEEIKKIKEEIKEAVEEKFGTSIANLFRLSIEEMTKVKEKKECEKRLSKFVDFILSTAERNRLKKLR
ncbi:MAG: hypothetical protein Q7T79_02975 [bacterium]|nr:hypothetical protein [bacterium]